MISFSVTGAEGRWFDSTSSCYVGTLGKSFTRNNIACMTDVVPCGCHAAKFPTPNFLLLPESL